MPIIARFYGIVIRMYYEDHAPPHFHASVGHAKGWVLIETGVVARGELPPTAERMVQEWALANKAELERNWQRALDHLPLEKIGGPDANY